MCGIGGYWSSSFVSKNVATNMTKALSNRGPDDSGIYFDDESGLSLVHTRLSIIDLSVAGHQPMTSSCGRFHLVFNGEIYNHLNLRKELVSELKAIPWIGDSDSETLLIALSHWGIEKTLNRINGMFAFALWDKLERTLYLARDRMGEKPLYYGRCGNSFLFGSELKALAVHPDWTGKVNRDSLALFLKHNCVPSPHSIYDGISKLSPGHFVVINNADQTTFEPVCYWSISEQSLKGIILGHKFNDYPVADISAELHSLLQDAVRCRMQSDVPLGAFLSGGYDSSLIVSLMQAASSKPVKTYSVGFNEASYNEANHARAVSNILGTDHSEIFITHKDAQEVIPELSWIYDEPFSDSSQIPTYLVCKLARKNVTVALSGDGGDELFAGYNRHIFGPALWSKTRRLPKPIRPFLSTFLSNIANIKIQSFLEHTPYFSKVHDLSSKLHKFANAIKADSGIEFYDLIASHWSESESVVIGAVGPRNIFHMQNIPPEISDLRSVMQYLDQTTYLPNDILTKVDRASMSVGLEARVPFLDPRLVDFSWSIPDHLKVKNDQGKTLLREILYNYVPRELMDRPKQGFSIPLADWLRGPLREWADDLLNENRLKSDGFFNPSIVREKWKIHLDGRDGWHYHLWDILMFQCWLDANPKAH